MRSPASQWAKHISPFHPHSETGVRFLQHGTLTHSCVYQAKAELASSSAVSHCFTGPSPWSIFLDIGESWLWESWPGSVAALAVATWHTMKTGGWVDDFGLVSWHFIQNTRERHIDDLKKKEYVAPCSFWAHSAIIYRFPFMHRSRRLGGGATGFSWLPQGPGSDTKDWDVQSDAWVPSQVSPLTRWHL